MLAKADIIILGLQIHDVGLRSQTPLSEAELLDSKVALIQALIPLGLQAVAEALEQEITGLVGHRYSRTGGRPGHVRWDHQRGSMYLMDQKLPLAYPRVRRSPSAGGGPPDHVSWAAASPLS